VKIIADEWMSLVDQLRLMIDPVLVGTGKRLFPGDGGLRA
jgi:dihydrofolate reductase